MRNKLLATTAVAGGLLMWVASAQALTVGISLSQSGGTDAGASASTSHSSSAVFHGAVGNFNSNTVTGTGSPTIPEPQLETTTINTSTAGCGTSSCTLTVEITETGLSPLQANFIDSYDWVTVSGDVTGVVFSTYISKTDVAFGLTTLLTTQNVVTAFNSVQLSSGVEDLTSDFSETEVYTITCGDADCSVDLGAEIAIPEPASLTLLGSALIGMGAFGRRRRRKAA
jgi:PEP-CTERM motif